VRRLIRPVAVPAEVPDYTLLAPLRHAGCYADCFTLTLPFAVTKEEFIESFYTTTLFKSERLVLFLFAGKKSTDKDAQNLAQGTGNSFAVWRVDQRTADELLLSEPIGGTSSWFMTRLENVASDTVTRLFFGSAIRPKRAPTAGETPQFSSVFTGLRPLHNLYSRKLLEAAAVSLLRDRQDTTPSVTVSRDDLLQ